MKKGLNGNEITGTFYLKKKLVSIYQCEFRTEKALDKKVITCISNGKSMYLI